MTYIEILNAFWNWRRFNVIPHSAADLFFCLLDFANAAKWEDKVTIPNSRITGKIDISEKSLFNARNVLIQNELIDYKNGKKGQAGTYKINLTTLYFYINKGSNQGSNKGSNSGVIRGAIGGTYKDKDKEEDKDKIRAAEEVKEDAAASAALKDVLAEYENNIGIPSPVIADSIADWLKDVDADVIKFAIGEAVKHESRNWKYIHAILNNHFNAGRKTLSAIKNSSRTFQSAAKNLSVYQSDGTDYDELERLMHKKYNAEHKSSEEDTGNEN